MTYLLDANVLVALHNDQNDDFELAQDWFGSLGRNKFATCAKTQGGFLRAHLIFFSHEGVPRAFEKIKVVASLKNHVWWGDDLSYVDVNSKNLQGRKQIADAWLAELCRQKKGKLATFDKALVKLHSDVAVLVE